MQASCGAGAARAPLGHAAAQQQQRQSSSAGAARPGSSKPAPTIRTPRGRSRGGRSPRAGPVGQIWRPSTPIRLCMGSSRAWWCQQATTDSQMKQGTMIELGWVLDITMEQSMPSKHQHKPAQLHVASIACGCVAPQLWNTRKVASKLTTSSCSSAAVGEKVASSTIEPASQHSRHGRRERARRHKIALLRS